MSRSSEAAPVAPLAALCTDTTAYRRAATDLDFFARHYLPHYFSLPSPAFHRELDALWSARVMKRGDPVRDCAQMLAEKGTRCAVAAPRGHAKSTVISLKGALHAALYGYKKYILLVSDTEAQAVSFLDAIKTELEENDRIIADILEKERLLRRETGRGYTLFGAETNQFQWFLKEQLARESAKAGLYLPIQGVRATEDKTLRVESLQPDIRNGYILFRRDQTLLLQQLSEFPLGAHDDGPDALEGARSLWRKGSAPAQLKGLHI